MKEHDKKLDEIVSLAVEHWNKNFCGISGINISERLAKTNEEVMSAMEKLNELGMGSLNRNVQLFSIKIGPKTPNSKFPDKPTTTHVFSPSKKLLSEHYYNSELVRQNQPEYKARMHQGGHPLELAYF